MYIQHQNFCDGANLALGMKGHTAAHIFVHVIACIRCIFILGNHVPCIVCVFLYYCCGHIHVPEQLPAMEFVSIRLDHC